MSKRANSARASDGVSMQSPSTFFAKTVLPAPRKVIFVVSNLSLLDSGSSSRQHSAHPPCCSPIDRPNAAIRQPFFPPSIPRSRPGRPVDAAHRAHFSPGGRAVRRPSVRRRRDPALRPGAWTELPTVEFEVSRGAEGIKVASEGGGRSEESLWVPGRGIISWRLTDPAAGSDLRAERTGDIVRVTGRLKGREITRELKIDTAPWYQIWGPGHRGSALLRHRADGILGSQSRRPCNAQDARPAGRLGTPGNRRAQVDTFKIHFSPAGALAPFWGADFWYRPSDSAYLFSRLPENGGLTITSIIW